MTDIVPADREVEAVDLDDVEPEPAAEPGDRANPLTLEAVHREAFMRRSESPFGDDPTVATPGEDCEPQTSGPGDPGNVVTLAKYGRYADGGGDDADDSAGVAGGGLVAVDRETGEPIEGGTSLVPERDRFTDKSDTGSDDGADDESDEDFSKLTVAELKERAVDSGYEESDVKGLKKDELLALDLA